MYALRRLRVLRSHDIPATSLHDVFRATVVSKITYCSPAWTGMCSAVDRARLDSFLNRCKRLGSCDKDLPSVTELVFSDADDALLERINTKLTTVLQRYLPDRPDPHYSLRERSHNKSLITKSSAWAVWTRLFLSQCNIVRIVIDILIFAFCILSITPCWVASDNF